MLIGGQYSGKTMVKWMPQNNLIFLYLGRKREIGLLDVIVLITFQPRGGKKVVIGGQKWSTMVNLVFCYSGAP